MKGGGGGGLDDKVECKNVSLLILWLTSSSNSCRLWRGWCPCDRRLTSVCVALHFSLPDKPLIHSDRSDRC